MATDVKVRKQLKSGVDAENFYGSSYNIYVLESKS